VGLGATKWKSVQPRSSLNRVRLYTVAMSQLEIERLECAIQQRIVRQMLKPKKYSNYLNPAAAAQEARIAEKKRNRELYGDALEDVDFLRRCGWAINLTCDGRIQFGNQLLTLGELREKAERERRLRQPAPTPIGTTRVQA
jgi:hypothetical protein